MSIIELAAWLGNSPGAAVVLALVALCGIAYESLRGRQ